MEWLGLNYKVGRLEGGVNVVGMQKSGDIYAAGYQVCSRSGQYSVGSGQSQFTVVGDSNLFSFGVIPYA
jgi:hypothetical protein